MVQDDTLALLQSSIRTLNLVQRVSAGVFSSFLIVHLSAPIIAAITLKDDAESAASGFMLVGREWYQGGKKEAVVVWGSAGVHVVSGVAGRALKKAERKERRRRRKVAVMEDAKRVEALGEDSELPTIVPTSPTSSDSAIDQDEFEPESDLPIISSSTTTRTVPSSSPSFSPHHLAGYLLIPFALHHSILHRLLPLKQHITPFFSYSFVGYSLSSSPLLRLISLVGYAGVLGLGAHHALTGVRILWDPTAPRSLVPRRGGAQKGLKKRGWHVAYLGVVATVGIGVARIAWATKGEGKVPIWLGAKYAKVLSHGVGLKMI